MSKNIVPRWEWRTFGKEFAKSERAIKRYPQGNKKISEEVYIISKMKNNNMKIRENVVDVKKLQEINENKLERWDPVMKEKFPIAAEKVLELIHFLGIKIKSPSRSQYNLNQFLQEVIVPSEILKLVRVKKTRSIYVINQCIVELVDTEIDGIPFKTVCIEHTKPDKVTQTMSMLGFDNTENINYIKAIKQISKIKLA